MEEVAHVGVKELGHIKDPVKRDGKFNFFITFQIGDDQCINVRSLYGYEDFSDGLPEVQQQLAEPSHVPNKFE